MEELTKEELLEVQGGGLLQDALAAVGRALADMAGDALDSMRGPNA